MGSRLEPPPRVPGQVRRTRLGRDLAVAFIVATCVAAAFLALAWAVGAAPAGALGTLPP